MSPHAGRAEARATLLPHLPSRARILIVRLRSIGDIVLLTPALDLLKKWRADLRVSVLIESRFRELLQDHPAIDEVLDLGAGSGWRQLAGRTRIVRALRRQKFSLCLNLHGGPTSSFLTRFSGARWKVGFHHFRDHGAYDFLVPDARSILEQPTLHTAEHQAAALFWLGLPRSAVPAARIVVSEKHRAWWQAERQVLGLGDGQKYAIVHPTALYPTKQWSPEHFRRAGDFLERSNIAPLYSCGPAESSVLERVEHAARGSIRRLETGSLGQFAAALGGAAIFIGNDSGPAHMAGALDRPRVVIFGSSSSVIWGPWPRDDARARVVQNPFACNPCPGDRCYQFPQPECILSVTVEQVLEAIQGVLAQTATSSR